MSWGRSLNCQTLQLWDYMNLAQCSPEPSEIFQTKFRQFHEVHDVLMVEPLLHGVTHSPYLKVWRKYKKHPPPQDFIAILLRNLDLLIDFFLQISLNYLLSPNTCILLPDSFASS